MIEIKKILFPTDFSEYSNHALKYAVALAESFKAKLVVLHVCEHPIADQASKHTTSRFLSTSSIWSSASARRSTPLTTELRERRVEVEPIFIIGKAYQEIVKAAKQHEVDVITMATHGSKGLSHLVFGSTAEKVVRLAPCPVLTVKHPEHDFVK